MTEALMPACSKLDFKRLSPREGDDVAAKGICTKATLGDVFLATLIALGCSRFRFDITREIGVIMGWAVCPPRVRVARFFKLCNEIDMLARPCKIVGGDHAAAAVG